MRAHNATFSWSAAPSAASALLILGPLLAAALLHLLAPSASAQLAFGANERLASNDMRIRLTVPAGTLARIDATTDLTNWSPFLTVSAGSLVHTDTFAPYLSGRYYRALEVPAGTMTGDHVPADQSDIVIRPVTHASFVMTWNGITIYNDPDTGTYTGLPKANIILVSHDHTDHWDSAVITAQKDASTKIVAPQNTYNQFSATLKASTIILANGASTNISGIEILAIPAYNANHAKGAGNGYVVTLGGKRFYMAGDTGDISEARALQNIDVAFIPMNTPFTMTVQQAAAMVRAFAPRIVYPYHFRNQDGTLANLTTFKNLVGQDLKIEVRARKWY